MIAVPTQPERDGDIAVEDGWSVDLDEGVGREDVTHSGLGVVATADVEKLREVIQVPL